MAFCIADGAGGTAGGRLASERVESRFQESVYSDQFSNPDDFESFLRKLDTEIHNSSNCGETTVVIGLICENEIIGGSVGDSQCWLFYGEKAFEITQMQNRKPLLGSGMSIPIGFGPIPMGEQLLAGSDGFFNYVDPLQLPLMLRENPHFTAEDIAQLAQNRAGKYSDDIAIVYVA